MDVSVCVSSVCVLRVALVGEGWCRSGEVHGPQGVVVNLNSFGQRLGVPTVTLTRHMAALSAAEWRRPVTTHDQRWRKYSDSKSF